MRKAYLAAAMKHHPDKGGTQEQFIRVRKAYEAVSNAPQQATAWKHPYFWTACDRMERDLNSRKRKRNDTTSARKKPSPDIVRLRANVADWRKLNITVRQVMYCKTETEEAEELIRLMRACDAQRLVYMQSAERLAAKIKARQAPVGTAGAGGPTA